jgi:hypothetical protein
VRHRGCGPKVAGGSSSPERVGIGGDGFKYGDGDGPPTADLDRR